MTGNIVATNIIFAFVAIIFIIGTTINVKKLINKIRDRKKDGEK